MPDDAEQQLYSDMADLIEKVPKLHNEIKSLKRRLTKLSNRIESLELLAFQDQLSKLNDEFKSLNTNLIAVSQVIAFNEMDALDLHMQGAIKNVLRQDDPNKSRLKEYIAVEHAKANEKNKNSPIPLNVLKAFRKECISCSEKYNLGAFESKPY